MEIPDHELLARRIYNYIKQNLQTDDSEYLILTMNEAEQEFYHHHLLEFFSEAINRTETHPRSCTKILLDCGTRIRIINYTLPHFFDSLMRGYTTDKWWATTELLPKDVRILLSACERKFQEAQYAKMYLL